MEKTTLINKASNDKNNFTGMNYRIWQTNDDWIVDKSDARQWNWAAGGENDKMEISWEIAVNPPRRNQFDAIASAWFECRVHDRMPLKARGDWHVDGALGCNRNLFYVEKIMRDKEVKRWMDSLKVRTFFCLRHSLPRATVWCGSR